MSPEPLVLILIPNFQDVWTQKSRLPHALGNNAMRTTRDVPVTFRLRFCCDSKSLSVLEGATYGPQRLPNSAAKCQVTWSPGVRSTTANCLDLCHFAVLGLVDD